MANTTDALAAFVRWDLFRNSMLRFMENYDAVLSPVTPYPALLHGTGFDEDNRKGFGYAQMYNLTGGPRRPCASVPRRRACRRRSGRRPAVARGRGAGAGPHLEKTSAVGKCRRRFEGRRSEESDARASIPRVTTSIRRCKASTSIHRCKVSAGAHSVARCAAEILAQIAAACWRLFQHGAAGAAKRIRILPQASHNPVHIGYLIATQPHHVGRTSHLLFPGSAILLREGSILGGSCAADRNCNARHKPPTLAWPGPFCRRGWCAEVRATMQCQPAERMRPEQRWFGQKNVRLVPDPPLKSESRRLSRNSLDARPRSCG